MEPAALALYEEAIRHDHDSRIAESGALVAYSGTKTRRSPKDKRVVRQPQSEKDAWWGNVNIPLDPRSYEVNRHTEGMSSKTSIDLSIEDREVVILARVCRRDEEGRVHDHELPDSRQGRPLDARLD